MPAQTQIGLYDANGAYYLVTMSNLGTGLDITPATPPPPPTPPVPNTKRRG